MRYCIAAIFKMLIRDDLRIGFWKDIVIVSIYNGKHNSWGRMRPQWGW